MRNNIFITGAAGGFGRAVARLFASHGYFIGLFDINAAGLEEIAAELGPENCCHQTLDVTDPDDCTRALEYYASHTGGKLQILLNNAGITAVGSYETTPLKQHLKIVDVNLKGPMTLTYLAFPYLKDTAGAHVISVASASSLHGNPELPSYALTKRALNSFTESLDISWEPYGIAASDINPIYARTSMVTDYQHLHRNLPDKQVRLTPEDVANDIWKITKSKKVHTYTGTDTKIFAVLKNLVPFSLQRTIMKKVIGYE